MNHFVDAAVDKTAAVAKSKLKGMFGGGAAQKTPQSGGMGGIGGLFPSAGEGSKGKGGGILDSFIPQIKTEPKPEPRPDAGPGVRNDMAGAAGDADFNSAVDELGGF